MKLKLPAMIIIIASYLVLSPSALAQSAGPSFNYVSASYLNLDAVDEDLNGIELEFNTNVGNAVFILGGLDIANQNSIDYYSAEIGAGYKLYYDNLTAWYVGGSVITQEVDVPGVGSIDDSGWSVFTGVRHRLNQKIELDAYVQHIDIFDDSDQAINLVGSYFFSPNLSVKAGYTRVDADNSAMKIGFAYHF